MARTLNLALIPGDGIGTEVVAEALKVLDAVKGDMTVTTQEYDLGARLYNRTGETLPPAVLEELRPTRARCCPCASSSTTTSTTARSSSTPA